VQRAAQFSWDLAARLTLQVYYEVAGAEYTGAEYTKDKLRTVLKVRASS
jgi:hypothetical protein